MAKCSTFSGTGGVKFPRVLGQGVGRWRLLDLFCRPVQELRQLREMQVRGLRRGGVRLVWSWWESSLARSPAVFARAGSRWPPCPKCSGSARWMCPGGGSAPSPKQVPLQLGKVHMRSTRAGGTSRVPPTRSSRTPGGAASPWTVVVVFAAVAVAMAVLMVRVIRSDTPVATARELPATLQSQAFLQQMSAWAPAPAPFREIQMADLLDAGQASSLDGVSVSFVVTPYLLSQNTGQGAVLLLGTPHRPLPAWFLGDARARGPGPQHLRGVYQHGTGSLFVHQMEPALPSACPTDAQSARSVTWGLFGLGAGLFVLGFATLRPRRGLAFSLLLVTVLGAGCEIQVSTVLEGDGQAVFQTNLVGNVQETAFLGTMPNFEGYLVAWRKALEARGYKVQVQRSGGALSFSLQRPPVPAEAAMTQASEGSSWTSLVSQRCAGVTIHRVLARVSTSEIVAAAVEASQDPMIRSALADEVRKFQVSVAVQLPGQPTFHNAARVEEGGRRGVWSLEMGQDHLLAIEQVQGRAGSDQTFQGAVTFALCGLAAAVTGVLFALFRRVGVAS